MWKTETDPESDGFAVPSDAARRRDGTEWALFSTRQHACGWEDTAEVVLLKCRPHGVLGYKPDRLVYL